MKIIKISSRKDWQKYIEEFKQELKEKDIDKKEKITRNKLFNYIKTKNIKTLFFHGTSESLYEKMKENEYMMSPIYLNTTQYEKRIQGLDKIFFTKNIENANYYKQRAEEQTKREGILLVLEIPIYRIAEIQATIFDSNTYNEGRGLIELENIIDEYIPYLINDFDQYKNELVDEILTIVNDRSHPEFTVYGMIPTNQTKSGFQYIKKADEVEENQWFQWIENKQVNPLDTPEEIQKQFTDEQWFQWVEEKRIDPIFIPKEIQKGIEDNQWIKWIEEEIVNPIDMPVEIKQQITDVNKWIQWIEEDIINNITYIPREIKKEIQQQITNANKWIQWVEKDKIMPMAMPLEIQKQITDKQWIQWFEKGKVNPKDMSTKIKKQIKNINKWIQWVEKGRVDLIDMPLEIQQKIEIKQWIEWVEEGKIYPIYIPEEIREQIEDINKWIKWVEKGKIYPMYIPKKIKQQITDVNKWMQWVEEDKIDIEDIPNYIKEKINQQKQSMNWYKSIKRNIK